MIEVARRSFLTGLGAALIAAPAIVRAGSLMPIKVTIIPPFAPFGVDMEWSDIVVATLRNRSSALAQNVTRNNALLRRLRGDDFPHLALHA